MSRESAGPNNVVPDDAAPRDGVRRGVASAAPRRGVAATAPDGWRLAPRPSDVPDDQLKLPEQLLLHERHHEVVPPAASSSPDSHAPLTVVGP